MSLTSSLVINESASSFGASYLVEGVLERNFYPSQTILMESAIEASSLFLFDALVESWLLGQAAAVLNNKREQEILKDAIRIGGVASVAYLLKKYVLGQPADLKYEAKRALLTIPMQRWVRGSNILKF